MLHIFNACDRVWQPGLLKKLKSYGFSTFVCHFWESHVILDVLQDYPVIVEVLQSFMLGPMFFL